MEEWRPIKDTKGLIEVSNLGRTRSWLTGTPKILKAQSDTKGYLRIRVTIERQKMSFKVHREVAKAFLDNHDKLPQVNHIDGDKTNNNVSNLEWISNKDNAHHAIKNGLWENVLLGAKKENEKRMTPIIARNIETGESIRFVSVSAAERYFNSRHISDVLNKKRETCKGYTFSREVVTP